MSGPSRTSVKAEGMARLKAGIGLLLSLSMLPRPFCWCCCSGCWYCCAACCRCCCGPDQGLPLGCCQAGAAARLVAAELGPSCTGLPTAPSLQPPAESGVGAAATDEGLSATTAVGEVGCCPMLGGRLGVSARKIAK
jgi:hypothetical protein